MAGTTNRTRDARIHTFRVVSVGMLLAVGIFGAGCAVDDAAVPSAFSPVGEEPSPAPPPTPAATNPVGTGETVAVAIDNAAGGTVTLSDGTAIEVPAGALPDGVDTITVTSSPEAAPAEYKTVSPVYVFGPDGTVFLKPLKVTLAFSAAGGTDTSKLTVLWSRPSGAGFDMVPTEFASAASGFSAAGSVTHFSQGVVGEKYETDPHPPVDPYASSY